MVAVGRQPPDWAGARGPVGIRARDDQGLQLCKEAEPPHRVLQKKESKDKDLDFQVRQRETSLEAKK